MHGGGGGGNQLFKCSGHRTQLGGMGSTLRIHTAISGQWQGSCFRLCYASSVLQAPLTFCSLLFKGPHFLCFFFFSIQPFFDYVYLSGFYFTKKYLIKWNGFS